MATRKTSARLSEEEFTHRAIRILREGDHKGIHAVYSGFNGAFREYFGTDPVAAMSRLEAVGKVVVRPARGGAILYIPGEAPWRLPQDKVLQKILER